MIKGFGLEKEQMLHQLERIGERSRRTSLQMSSGYRINAPSDSPEDLATLIRRQTELAHADQSLINMQNAADEVNTAEAAVRNGITLLEKALVAGTKGANGTNTIIGWGALAEEVRSLHEDMVRISNQEFNGHFVFGGDQDNVSPYTVNWAAPGGVTRNNNAPDSRLVEDVDGNRFAISKRAEDLFDLRDSSDASTSGNVFAALSELAAALESKDNVRVEAALHPLKKASEHLNAELASYGNTQVRLDQAAEQSRKRKLEATADIATIRDVDLPAAILELTQLQTTLQASLAAQSKFTQKSLFDYLG